MIVETEAYRAPEDKASHAYLNRKTNRTRTMFMPGGHAYIYLCYGIHHLFNIVTGPKEHAHAVLIRAIEPTEGLDHMEERRQQSAGKYQLTAGPGRLTQALGITRRFDGEPLLQKRLIWIEDRLQDIPKEQIISSPRIGVEYAEECAAWPWRFSILHHPWCSHPKPQQ